MTGVQTCALPISEFAVRWRDARGKEERSLEVYKEEQYEKLARLVRGALDMERIYEMMEGQDG